MDSTETVACVRVVLRLVVSCVSDMVSDWKCRFVIRRFLNEYVTPPHGALCIRHIRYIAALESQSDTAAVKAVPQDEKEPRLSFFGLRLSSHATMFESLPLMMLSASATIPVKSSSHVGTESMSPITGPQLQTLLSASPVSWNETL
jgi:hypothetical protein